jgi:hypothetical protein
VGPDYLTIGVSGGPGLHDPCHPSPFDHYFQKPVNLAALLEYLSGLRAGQTPPCPSMAVA